LEAEKALANPAKKAFNFSLGRAITHRRVCQEAANAGTDLNDSLEV
jgi:hypothetical protein